MSYASSTYTYGSAIPHNSSLIAKRLEDAESQRKSLTQKLEEIKAALVQTAEKQDLIDYLETQVEELSAEAKRACPICYIEYTEQKVVSLAYCGHTVCTECFARLYIKKSNCPICRCRIK